MRDKGFVEELTVEELEELLYRKKRAERRLRLLRMKREGRLVDVAGLPPPEPTPPLFRPEAMPTGALQRYSLDSGNGAQERTEAGRPAGEEPVQWGWVANKLLLFVEIVAVTGLLVIGFMVWGGYRQLNQEIAQVQEAQSASVALPTATPTPVIDVVVLPGGHKRIDGRAIPGESGNIPEHLLPLVNAYVPPPIPTPGPEQARRIQIPAINIDKPIVQGDDWEQLKKGVGQHIGSALPGRPGNLVLSAHNDIFGEIFRHLDELTPGDEIIISTERQDYIYVVREVQVVEPTEVGVMDPTSYSSATLISCYPYLVNNKRIVIFADLATTGSPDG
ncbi:MAG: class D sortase [Chloroflexi bacterium]|nr:class D sortase [Chloroflexota bacterium]MCI0644809.1 class D sortase [Chloroflexota bacterium]MCI0731984.1 class D sortase [Chloroflexota bacterium]